MKKIIGAGLTFAPFLAFAQAGVVSLSGIDQLVSSIGGIINALTPIVFALALLYFFLGLAQFILASGDPEKASEGKSRMIWGVIALFVMATVFGLISFIQAQFGLTATGTITAPSVTGLPL